MKTEADYHPAVWTMWYTQCICCEHMEFQCLVSPSKPPHFWLHLVHCYGFWLGSPAPYLVTFVVSCILWQGCLMDSKHLAGFCSTKRHNAFCLNHNRDNITVIACISVKLQTTFDHINWRTGWNNKMYWCIIISAVKKSFNNCSFWTEKGVLSKYHNILHNMTSSIKLDLSKRVRTPHMQSF